MADDFIDRRAAGFREVVVVERRGVAVPRRTSLNRQSSWLERQQVTKMRSDKDG